MLVSRLLTLASAAFVPATIAAGALVCAYATWDLVTRPLSLEWLVLLALAGGAGWVTLRLPAMPISLSLSDTFIILTSVLIGPAAGAITAILDGLVQTFRMENEHRTLRRVLFNVAALACTTFVSGKVFFAIGGAAPVVPGVLGALRLLGSMVVFGGLFFMLNSGLVAIAVALDQRASVVTVWRKTFGSLWLSSFGGTFAAMQMLVLARQSAIEVVILMAPLPVLLYVAMRQGLGRAADQIEHLGKMNRVYVATIEALAQAVDAKDQVTHDHVRRVQEKSLQLAGRLGVRDEGQLQALKAAGLLHDVGKIGIPEHILNKPGRLTPAEFEIMKRHPTIGADILSVIGFPYPLIPIVRHHHENWDGTGYPDRVAGEAIPIGARILQVVDCFDALTSDRPYRRAMSEDDALAIVAERSGTMYDPRVVRALLDLHAESSAAAGGVSPHAGVAATAPGPRPGGPRGVPAAEAAAAILPPPDTRSELAVAADLGAAIAGHRDPALVGEAAWAVLRDVVPAAAFVFFVNDAQALVPAYRGGERTVAPHTRIPVGERLSGWVAATRRSIVNSDAHLDFDSDVRDTALRTAMAVPVHARGETLGVLAFYAERPDVFGDTHLRVAEAAAHAAAGALHQAPARAAVAV